MAQYEGKVVNVSDPHALRHAHEALMRGQVIAYPTDTVYGLGVCAADAAAVEKVRTIKGRDDTKPILALVSDMAMLEEYAYVTPLAHALASTFLPGPLTLVLATRDARLAPIASVDGSVGFRMPNHPVCIELPRQCGTPITSTSMNRSHMAQARTLHAMLEQLADTASDLSLVIDAGTLPENAPSTVVDARMEHAVILREGALAKEHLLRFL